MILLGADKVIARIRKIQTGMSKEIADALYEEAKIELREAKKRTPVATGALRKSGKVSKPKISGKTVTVDISFGGETAPYAVYVHEDLEAFHPIGQAKFLESVIEESRPHMAKRIAKRIELKRLV